MEFKSAGGRLWRELKEGVYTIMYGVKDTATTVVPTVAGAATLPATGGNTLLTTIVATVLAVGAIATLVQIGTIVYRRQLSK